MKPFWKGYIGCVLVVVGLFIIVMALPMFIIVGMVPGLITLFIGFDLAITGEYLLR